MVADKVKVIYSFVQGLCDVIEGRLRKEAELTKYNYYLIIRELNLRNASFLCRSCAPTLIVDFNQGFDGL